MRKERRKLPEGIGAEMQRSGKNKGPPMVSLNYVIMEIK